MLDEDFAELLLEPLPLVEDDDEGTLLEEAIFTLLLDLDEISSSFELLAEIDESLPQAVKNRANKKMNKVSHSALHGRCQPSGQTPRTKVAEPVEATLHVLPYPQPLPFVLHVPALSIAAAHV